MTDPSNPPTPAGVLLIDKPEGPTSMDVCRRVRAKLVAGGAPKRVKVGHGGTLDPLATGLVVVLAGGATKACDAVMAGEKRYRAEIDLSAFTPSDDRETARVDVEVAAAPAPADVRTALARFTGNIMQRPPAFSAMKLGGKRAYERARAGDDARLEPRPVVVHELDLARYEWPVAAVDIRCGKGVYVRSLARDLGESLGVGGTLVALRRTAVGPMRVDDATPFDRLPESLGQRDLLPVPIGVGPARAGD